MKQLFKDNKAFIIPYISVLLIVSAVLLYFDKVEIHIFINSFHNNFFDIFFKYWTYLGDGIFSAVFVVLLLFISYRKALISAVSLILTGLVIQILKHYVYFGNYRPVMYFKTEYEGNYKLHLIEGTEPANFFSFPSGHTAAAFVIFFLSAIFVKNKYLKFIFFISAFLVGYSRVYLSWHFVGDTVAGSLTGFVIVLITVSFISKNIKSDSSLLKKQQKYTS